MVREEFILLIPGIIYGVAIVDLLKILRRGVYFELAGCGIFFLLSVVNIWLELYDKLAIIATNNLDFLLVIIQAILFTKAVNILTPEDDDENTKTYFLSNIRSVFILLISVLIINLIIQIMVFDDQRTLWIRPLGALLYLSMIFAGQLKWVRLVILGINVLLMSAITLGILQ
jgi:hypothetical protein